jgi:hypothetical protein
MGTCGRIYPNCWRSTQFRTLRAFAVRSTAEEHMQRIADVIIRANPDVINLVEVENLNALATSTTRFSQGGFIARSWSRGRTRTLDRTWRYWPVLIPRVMPTHGLLCNLQIPTRPTLPCLPGLP